MNNLNAGLTCPKCGGHNVSVQIEQQGGKTRTKHTGCLWGMGRTLLIICTCGLWLLVGKRKETSNQQFVNKKIAICQNCGKSWHIR